jgi:RsiW-degrading membrane proteinase PrsW (M82 family)
MASVKAYLAAGAVAGLLAGVLLAVAVVVTAVPETVPEIAREVGVSVEEARVLYSAVLFGVAVGVGFAMFISWLLAALLWWFLEPRVDLPRPLLLVTPGILAAAVFLALAFFQAEPKDVALITTAALAASPAFQKLRERWTRQP